MTVPSVIVCAPHALRQQRTDMATVSAEAKPNVLIRERGHTGIHFGQSKAQQGIGFQRLQARFGVVNSLERIFRKRIAQT